MSIFGRVHYRRFHCSGCVWWSSGEVVSLPNDATNLCPIHWPVILCNGFSTSLPLISFNYVPYFL